jgi:uncharacterized RDD family membrane protein YckC
LTGVLEVERERAMEHQPGQNGAAREQYSVDGRWWWNGRIWLPAREAPRQVEARVAPHSLRSLAFAIDVLCVAIVAASLVLLGKLANIESLTLFVVAVTAGFVAYTSASVWLTDGQTIGKAACGLVVHRIDGAAPGRTLRGLAWAIGRHSVGYFVADVFGLGVLFALTNRRRRCLHDYAFGSEVLMCPTGSSRSLESPSARLRAFRARLEAAQTDAGWASFLARWLVKLIVYPAVLILYVAGRLPAPSPLRRVRDSIAQSITEAAHRAPLATSVPPATGLSPVSSAGLWAGTSVATGTVAVLAASVVLAHSLIGTWDDHIEVRQNGPGSLVGVTVTKTTFKTNDCPIAAGTEKWRIQALPPRYTGSELWASGDRGRNCDYQFGPASFELKDQNTLEICSTDPFPGSQGRKCDTHHRTG